MEKYVALLNNLTINKHRQNKQHRLCLFGCLHYDSIHTLNFYVFHVAFVFVFFIFHVASSICK